MDFLVGRGLFNRELHHVLPGNAARLHAQERRFALSECGKACVLLPVPDTFPVLLGCRDCLARRTTDDLPAAVVPAQVSADLMQRVLTGLQRL